MPKRKRQYEQCIYDNNLKQGPHRGKAGEGNKNDQQKKMAENEEKKTTTKTTNNNEHVGKH